MATTARSMILRALKNIGVAAEGETPSAEMMNDALVTLNMMLQSWCANNLLTTALIGEVFPLVALQNAYDIGPTYGTPPIVSDFTTSKPITIKEAWLLDAALTVYPVEVATVDEIFAFATNLVEFGRPTRIVYDVGPAQQVGHIGTIYTFPIPDVVYQLAIVSEKPFTELATLDTNVTFPPSYDRAIVANLSIELYPQYPKAGGIDPVIIKIAKDSLDIIETVNSVNKRKNADLGLPIGNTGNILTGG